MLKGTKKTITKEQELLLGAVIQDGLAAQRKIEEADELTIDELTRLERLVESGKTAHDYLFETHIPLANRLARKIQKQTNTSYPLEDLEQDAYFALSEAANTYDPSHDCVLTTHAYYKITKALSVTVNKMRPVRLPENKMGDYLHITKAEQKYIQAHNGIVDPEEMLQFVIDETGLPRETISLIKQTMKGAVSLNAPLSEDGGEFGDLIKDENVVKPVIENDLLANIISELTPFEQDVIALDMQVGTPSVKLEDFLVSYNMSMEDLHKQSKKIVRALKKQMKKGAF